MKGSQRIIILISAIAAISASVVVVAAERSMDAKYSRERTSSIK
jgi:hypothetical protein